jgi:hypothetical protein
MRGALPLAGGGLTPEQRAAMSTFGDVGSGYGAAADRARAAFSPVSAGYSSIAANGGLSPEQRAAMTSLGGVGGKYKEMATAYDPNSAAFKRLRQGVVDDTLSNLGSQFTASGRFGGGSYIDTASEGLGDALAGLDYSNMQNNRYRSLDSERGVLGDTFSMSQAGTGNRLAGLGGAADIASRVFAGDASALAGRQGAATAQFTGGQQGIQNEQAALDALAGVGAAQDANTQGTRLGDADLYDRKNNAQLDWLKQIASTFGGNGPVDAANQPEWWQQLLGGALGLGGSALSGGVFK